MASREVYQFGEFKLDVEERSLTKRGHAVVLVPKAYDVLVVLVRNGGRLVRKNEILRAVWPETFVEEESWRSISRNCARLWADDSTLKPWRARDTDG